MQSANRITLNQTCEATPRPALLWDMQHRVVIRYRCLETPYQPHLLRSRNSKERTEHDWS